MLNDKLIQSLNKTKQSLIELNVLLHELTNDREVQKYINNEINRLVKFSHEEFNSYIIGMIDRKIKDDRNYFIKRSRRGMH
jgi:uncharacterized membrane-anchored protein YjiN (DUF445 family)